MTTSIVISNIPTVHAISSKSEPLNTVEQIHSAFPESYWEGLDSLKTNHPEWKFVAFYTGLTWDECFNDNAEIYPSRNLAYGYINGQLYFPTSWYSTDIPGSYNWAANEWTKYDNGNWLQASKEAIEYCMDPRNFFDEVQIFQFMDTASALNSNNSVAAVQSVLKGPYWNQSGQDSNVYDYINDDGTKHYLTYAEALVQIGQQLNLNQITLASRLYQENGGGKSPLITGTQAFTTRDGSYIDGGYYNYFNINASGNTNSDIIQNGLRKAYENGWDTKYKSLLGGAEEIMKSFVKRGQTTIYSQKFSVDSSSSRLFWGQYMQNITAPQTESVNIYKAMVEAGAIDSDLTFIIPVFENMPESTEYPEKDGNPNYKLGSIYVNGTSVDGFDTDRVEYTLNTNMAEIKVNLLAYANTTFITYKDISTEGKLSTVIPLEYGENLLDFVCTAQNGDSRIYRLVVNRLIPDNITPPQEIAPTPSEEENSNETPTDNIKDPEWNPEPEDNITSVSNDINQDGVWDIFDAAIIYSHILDTCQLTEGQLILADINKDGEVDIFDAAIIYQYILGYIDTIE